MRLKALALIDDLRWLLSLRSYLGCRLLRGAVPDGLVTVSHLSLLFMPDHSPVFDCLFIC